LEHGWHRAPSTESIRPERLIEQPLSETAVLLFAHQPRVDSSFSRHDETWFAFLDRVDDVVFDRIRILLNEWFSELPTSKASRIRDDFTSGRDVQVEAAFLELFLHAAFRRTPLSVEVEPGRAQGRQPDFRCWPPNDESAFFYAEARLVGDPAAFRGREKRLKRAFDEVNKAAAPGLTVWVEIVTEGKATPRGAELRRQILPWLERFDPTALRASVENSAGRPSLPEQVFTVGDWRFRIRAWPLRPEAGAINDDGRLIGVEPARTAWGGSTQMMAKALKSKKGRYELKERPFLIAVGNTHSFQGTEDALNVLYGSEAVDILGERDGELITRVARQPDGLFRPHRNRRVSAVLHVPRLMPWSVGQIKPELWLNPFAQAPLSVSLPWGAELVLRDDTVARRRPRVSLLELFDLPAAWPGPERPFRRSGQSVPQAQPATGSRGSG
jgi:hypothetical protein